jgi:hypothetical protein
VWNVKPLLHKEDLDNSFGIKNTTASKKKGQEDIIFNMVAASRKSCENINSR